MKERASFDYQATKIGAFFVIANYLRIKVKTLGHLFGALE